MARLTAKLEEQFAEAVMLDLQEATQARLADLRG